MEDVLENVRLSDTDDSVIIIDQTRLPNELSYIELKTAADIYRAIYELQVRGAPAIGICAGFCLYVLAKGIADLDRSAFAAKLQEYSDYLNSARPTAVNLSWAIRRMMGVVHGNPDADVPQLLELLKKECIAIQDEDIKMCRAISEHGLTLLHDGDGILTHCNAGPLATSRYGTALGPLFLGKERGMNFKVYADETRPLLQGARLTAFELSRAGIDVTLICDNMASIVMKNGWVQACFVGCDRVAENGDVANKIGTSGLAILAHYYGIPFYVLGPSSTVDLSCKTGEDIEIELRSPDEIKTMFYSKPMAPKEVRCYNPAFDVTDHSLITGIITEYGICRPPYNVNLRRMLKG
jgi:methylthioribose-1-phosphate isomerase